MSTTNYPGIAGPMTFLSLAPVASASYTLQNSPKTANNEVTKAEEIESALLRANSTSSDSSDSNGGEAAKQRRFLKLGHKDGDWSEEVIEA